MHCIHVTEIISYVIKCTGIDSDINQYNCKDDDMRLLKTLLVALPVALAAHIASAQESKNVVVYNSITGTEMARLVQEAGYRATLSKDSDGEPTIASADSGLDFNIYFYTCDKVTKDNCKTIMFVRGIDLKNGTNLSTINDWNSDSLYGASWLDDENDPYYGLTINFVGGITKEHLVEQISVFTRNMRRFEKAVNP